MTDFLRSAEQIIMSVMGRVSLYFFETHGSLRTKVMQHSLHTFLTTCRDEIPVFIPTSNDACCRKNLKYTSNIAPYPRKLESP
jgi:hypothetical protein